MARRLADVQGEDPIVVSLSWAALQCHYPPWIEWSPGILRDQQSAIQFRRPVWTNVMPLDMTLADVLEQLQSFVLHVHLNRLQRRQEDRLVQGVALGFVAEEQHHVGDALALVLGQADVYEDPLGICGVKVPRSSARLL